MSILLFRVDCTLGREKGAGWRLRWVALSLDACVTLVTAFRLLPLMDHVSCYVHSLDGAESVYGYRRYNRNTGCDSQLCGGIGVFWSAFLLIFIFLLYARGKKGRRCSAVVLCILFLWIYVYNSVTVTGRVDGCGESRYAEVYLNCSIK